MNDLTKNLHLTPPVRSYQEVYPHLTGIAPRVDHRSTTATAHEQLPAYGSPMVNPVTRVGRSQAEAERAHAAAREAQAVRERAQDLDARLSTVLTDLRACKAVTLAQAEQLAQLKERVDRLLKRFGERLDAIDVRVGTLEGDVA